MIELIILVILALAFPVGIYVSSKADDELKVGRVWFRLLVIFSLIAGFIGGALGKSEVSLTAGFMIIVAFVALSKG